jgi:Zn-finger nucleic acid-binding protein
MTERQGVEIDYYPQYRGVWLDREELDKLIEHSMGQETPFSELGQPSFSHKGDDCSSRLCSHVQDHRRKKSWIAETFDWSLMDRPIQVEMRHRAQCKRYKPWNTLD